ncbi:Fe-S protein assembly co-chaperone HscB [Magnetovibrio blakemorei]|uniref:Co-chaperone protein HscB homolog n=1 Tax=Magnetovibrio blakemorei TaxID=28181 RepID=A0A1E5Q4N2_9PROT|nr:Fe-S protein assembly co-chaperone HscB [Magnetovibrio blakemorei]OEJ65212.1 Fe-S protein assembly co-chaperone HscB [Magnetovibrio blakemorei]
MLDVNTQSPETHLKPCWSCKGPSPATALFCHTCKAVQAPASVDHFARLGMEPTFDVDVAALDRLYFDLQRQLHPDRFATKAPKEKALSQRQATALNDAYEVLKNPLMRADYLVHLLGIDVLPEGCNLVHDQSILMEAMEMREKLMMADTQDALNAIQRETKTEIDDVLSALSLAFAGHDIQGACRLTTRLKYLDKMMGEVRHSRARLMS